MAPDWISTGRPDLFTAPESKCFLEVFAGRAHLSWTVAQMGVPVLAPVDLHPFPPLVHSTNALDQDTESAIGEWITAGKVGWIHLAPECKTFSSSRNSHDGGPPPLRDADGIILDNVQGHNRDKALTADKLVSLTMRLVRLAHAHGAVITVENPERSTMWQTAPVRIIKDLLQLKYITFDQCATGSMHQKATSILTNKPSWFTNCPRCPTCSSGHKHIALKGMLEYEAVTLQAGSVHGTKTKVKVWKTSLAQTYGMGMCHWMAGTIVPKIWGINRPRAPPINEWGTQFGTSFNMVADPQKRKRRLYEMYPVSLKPSRYAAHMVSSGTQPKRGRTTPVFEKSFNQVKPSSGP